MIELKAWKIGEDIYIYTRAAFLEEDHELSSADREEGSLDGEVILQVEFG